MTIDRGNVVAVARREYLARGRTRTFKLTTILLVVIGLAVALAPLILRVVFGEGDEQTRIEVVIGDVNADVQVVPTLSAVLNAPIGVPVGGPGGGSGSGGGSGAGGGSGSGGSGADEPQFVVTAVEDESAARARVLSDETSGLLVIKRPTADADLTFDFVTKDSAGDRIPQLIQQAAGVIVIQDRLSGAGIPPVDQGQIFAPPAYAVSPADPSATPVDPSDAAGGGMGFVLAIVLFMAIVLYGQWIAYSVVEEKSSRVMEVILGAATPFELLSGKVVGVGALAITQYAIVFVPAMLALLFQNQIAALVLGGSADAISLPARLSIPLLLAFGLFFVLGFSLYAVLYAGAAALVSRTEDINQIVAPMTIISTIGYLVAVYSSTGLLDPKSTLVVVLSYIPFFSPYLMLSRIGAGVAGPVEVLVGLVLLAIAIPLALWVAARFYAAGVLMYGQRPSFRLMLRVLRGAR